MEDREVEERRGHDPDVGDVAAGGQDAADEGPAEARRAQPDVAPDGDPSSGRGRGRRWPSPGPGSPRRRRRGPRRRCRGCRIP
ncbi:MAG: hypothetical protein MZW92_67215 [Comamonadaceae bacterium]|nr:hypothetical protein [Comamonadaceae bacterium]